MDVKDYIVMNDIDKKIIRISLSLKLEKKNNRMKRY